MDSTPGLQADTFGEQLVTFLNAIQEGTRTPASEGGREGMLLKLECRCYYFISCTGHLPFRNWPPLHPPFHFPSDLDSDGSQFPREEGGYMEEVGFEQLGEMDLEGIPYDEPPRVRDYPAFEDQGHEDGMMGGGGTLQREEL